MAKILTPLVLTKVDTNTRESIDKPAEGVTLYGTEDGRVIAEDSQGNFYDLTNIDDITLLTNRADETDTEQAEQDRRIQELEEALADSLFEPLSITRFTISPSQALVGSTVNSLTFDTAVTGFPLENLRLVINNNVGEVPQGRVTRTLSPPIVGDRIKTVTFVVTASADDQDTRTRTAFFRFVNNVFFFVSDNEDPTDDDIESGLTVATNSKNRLFRYAANPDHEQGSFICTAYPKRLGLHSNILVNDLPSNDFTIITRPYTNVLGFTEDYYVYRSNNRTFGQDIPVRWQ